MSLPGAQPNPYEQPNPYQQPNPYAQPPPPVTGGYGQAPGQGAIPGPVPMGIPPGGTSFPAGPPGPPGGGRTGWLWGLGGALLASAVWAGSLLATGTLGDDGEPGPDLAGYRYHENVCDVAALDSFLEHYERDTSDSDYRFASEQEKLDVSYCSQGLEEPEADSDSYVSTLVAVSVEWHKGSDPADEFAARWKGYAQRDDEDSSFAVEEVEDVGEEAYLVTETDEEDALESMTLAVRDGWLTYDMAWNRFGGAGDEAFELSEKRISGMLTADTEDALEQLKKPGEDPPAPEDEDSSSERDPVDSGQEDV